MQQFLFFAFITQELSRDYKRHSLVVQQDQEGQVPQLSPKQRKNKGHNQHNIKYCLKNDRQYGLPV